MDEDNVCPRHISYGMSILDKLTEYFSKFPGIGPRQSRRFVYFLLLKNHSFLDELSGLILELKKEVSKCKECFRFFANSNIKEASCNICRDQNRDTNTLMIVGKDTDFENIERSGVYKGKYFILGGTVPILEENPERKVRSKELLKIIDGKVKNGLKEIILALSVNPEGENTVNYIKELLSPLIEKHSLKISILGRGLSTGTELEYPDKETIKNALKNRA